MTGAIDISVVYALSHDSFWEKMTVTEGTTAMEAVEKSCVLKKFSELDPAKFSLAIYSRPVKVDYVSQQDDRVEILRPLTVDPKTVPKKKKAKPAA